MGSFLDLLMLRSPVISHVREFIEHYQINIHELHPIHYRAGSMSESISLAEKIIVGS